MGSLPPARRLLARRICVIGAGPSGVAVAKFLKAERFFTQIDVFEQRANVGGLWDYTPPASGDGMFNVPQCSPHVGLERPLPFDASSETPVFLSPMYERLVTNIPKDLMRYPHKSFAEKIPLFPTHRQTQTYLEEDAKDILDVISFETQVERLSFLGNETEGEFETERWEVMTRHVRTKACMTRLYDAVVVASGHYSAPYIPDIKGIREWHTRHPRSLSHSKYYRRPEDFAGKQVLIVGNSASGQDIASQISTTNRAHIYISSRSESMYAGGFPEDSHIEDVREIASFNAEAGTINLVDGRILEGIDCVLFCTGYMYTLPFMDNLDLSPLVEDGSRFAHTYQHLIYAPHPSLTFMVLPQKIIPFRIVEAQAALVSRIYSGRCSLPSLAEMKAWEQRRVEQTDDKGGFHTFKFPEDGEYINMLCDWSAQADAREGLENAGAGTLPGRWGAREFWTREKFAAIRKAYVSSGAEPGTITSAEQLGFSFERLEAGDGKKNI